MRDADLVDHSAQRRKRHLQVVPVECFDTRNYATDDAIERWHTFAAGINDIVVDEDARKNLRMQTMAARIDMLVASTFFAKKHRFVRTQRHIASGFSEYVRLRLYRNGRSLAIYEEKPYEILPGAVHMIDYSRPVYEAVGDVDQIGLYIPHSAIGYDPSVHSQYLRFGLDTPAGLILADTIQTLVSAAPHLLENQAPSLASGIAGLVRGLIHGANTDQAQRAIQVARGRAFRTHIEQNLRDPDLGIASLSKVFGAARATIYRDFADDGGINRFITNRRLERAYLMLTDLPMERGAIKAACSHWGFSSATGFSRAFRERFGCTPSEVVGLRRSAGDGNQCQPGKPGETTPVKYGTASGSNLLGSWLSNL